MSDRIPTNPDEDDTFSRFRHKLKCMDKAGAAKKIKQHYNRRKRRAQRRELKAG